jgi:hypothetical protein
MLMITGRMLATRATRRLAVPLACLALGGLLAAVASAAESAAPKGAKASVSYRFGLSDYEPSTFSDPRVAELGVHLARDVVPWNVALNKRDLAQVTAWLDAVKHAYHIIPPTTTIARRLPVSS